MKKLSLVAILAFTSLSTFAEYETEAFKKLCPNINIAIERVGDVIVFAPEKCLVEELPLKNSKVVEILNNQKMVFDALGANDYYGIGHLAHFKTNAPAEIELKKENLAALKVLWMYFELKSNDVEVFSTRPLSIVTELDHRELERRFKFVRGDACYSCHDFDFALMTSEASQISRDEFANALSNEIVLEESYSDPEEIQIILDVWGAQVLKILLNAGASNDLNLKDATAELKTYFSESTIAAYHINDVGNENTWQGFYIYQAGYDVVLRSFIWDL